MKKEKPVIRKQDIRMINWGVDEKTTVFENINLNKEKLTAQKKALETLNEESVNQTAQMNNIISNLDEIISICNKINSSGKEGK